MKGKEQHTKGLIKNNYFQIFVKILIRKKTLIVALMVIFCTACHQMNGNVNGTGNIISENRTPGNFTGIEAGGAFEIELSNAGTTMVRVEADDNLIKFIETRVSGNTLKISLKSNMSFNNGHYKVYITAPNINYINMSGAAAANIKGILINTEKIRLECSGAAFIHGELQAPEVKTQSSGAATINISGKTKNYVAETSGSATTKSFDLRSETTDADASGASNLYVFSSMSLKADASGAASIHYTGEGNAVIKTSGAANIKKEN